MPGNILLETNILYTIAHPPCPPSQREGGRIPKTSGIRCLSTVSHSFSDYYPTSVLRGI